MVAVVLSDDLLRGQLPESGVVIGACGDKIGTIGAESTVPDPTLMLTQSAFEAKGDGGCHWWFSAVAVCILVSVLSSVT